MFADLLPPPTLVMDWYLLDFPFGVIAFASVTAAVVALFIALIRGGKPARNLWLAVICLALFVLCDLGAYFVAVNWSSGRRPPRPPDFGTKDAGTRSDP